MYNTLEVSDIKIYFSINCMVINVLKYKKYK